MMHNFDTGRFKVTSLIALGILLSVVLSKLLRAPEIALLLLAGIAAVCPLYAVRLYWKNDSMIGGLPRANYSYSAGLVTLWAGNVLTCWGFLSANKGSVYLGSVVFVGGIGILLAACSLLFQHTIRRGVRSPK